MIILESIISGLCLLFLGGVCLWFVGWVLYMMFWLTVEIVRDIIGWRPDPQKHRSITRHQQAVRDILALERELYGSNNNINQNRK